MPLLKQRSKSFGFCFADFLWRGKESQRGALPLSATVSREVPWVEPAQLDYEDDAVFFDHVSSSADADLDLIANAPEDIKALLNEVDRLNNALQEIDRRIDTADPDELADQVRSVLNNTF